MSEPTGYAHPRYAASLAEFGTPLQLPGSGGWLLERAIPGVDARDAMSCYPILCCRDWNALAEDLDAMEGHFVSVTAVTDPFGDYDDATLRRAFPRVRPFKEHVVADLACGPAANVSKHHRYYARRALASMAVSERHAPPDFAIAWDALYDVLRRRHRLSGLKAFSLAVFAEQLAVPGVRLFVAECDGELLGAHIWYVQGDVAYSHLQASTDTGYKRGAAYALYMTAMQTLAHDVRWLHIGAGAGAGAGGKDAGGDGLARFKAGWGTATRIAYLCGRILDPGAYEAACAAGGSDVRDDDGYFPAYRAGELT